MPDAGASTRRELLAWGKRHGLPVTPDYLARLDPFWDLLLRWSRRVDLVGYRDRESALRGLLAPSLAMAAVSGAGRGPGPVLDIGSGGGIPGIPLASLYPDTHFDLVEPRERRALFLREAVGLLSLANARVVRERLEALPAEGAYSAALSRALDPVPLLPWAARLLAPGAPWWVQASRLGAPGAAAPAGWKVEAEEIRDAAGQGLTFLRYEPRLRLAEPGGKG